MNRSGICDAFYKKTNNTFKKVTSEDIVLCFYKFFFLFDLSCRFPTITSVEEAVGRNETTDATAESDTELFPVQSASVSHGEGSMFG